MHSCNQRGMEWSYGVRQVKFVKLTCNEVRQIRIKILKKLHDALHEPDSVIVTIQQPFVSVSKRSVGQIRNKRGPSVAPIQGPQGGIIRVVTPGLVVELAFTNQNIWSWRVSCYICTHTLQRPSPRQLSAAHMAAVRCDTTGKTQCRQWGSSL